MAIHHDDDTATATPPSAATKTTTHATTTDPITQRVRDFVAKPARTAIQEYLRINAAATYLKAVTEAGGRHPSPTQPSPTQPSPTQPSPQPTTEGRKAAASIVGCLLESKFSPNERTKAGQAIVLRYLENHHPQYVDKVKSAFAAKTKAPFIQLVKSIVEDVEDRDDELFDKLMHACNDGD